jgi:flagellar hook assembly protein FlgD
VVDGNAGLLILQGYGPAGVKTEQEAPAELKVGSLKLKVLDNKINYQIPKDGPASLKVYNLLGQEVRCLVNEFISSGVYSLQWDGRNAGNRRVSSGVYLVRLQAGEQAATAKMVVVR